MKKVGCEKIYTEKFKGTKLERKGFQLLLERIT
nr:hypothetical protein [Enterococcus plantarum]